MASAPYLDLLGDSKGSAKQPAPSKASLVKAPVTDAKADAKAREQLAKTRQKVADDKRNTANAAYLNQRHKEQTEEARARARLMADPGPEGQAYRARQKFISSAGTDWGLIPLGAAVIGTGAAIIGTGGAAAGALGLAAGAGVATTGAALSQAAGALQSATKGKVPTAALGYVGGEAVAGLKLPAAVRVNVPDPKQALAAAKAAVKTPLAGAAKQIAGQVKQSVIAASGAPKIATPKVPTVKAVVNQAAAIGASLGMKPPTSTANILTSAMSAAKAMTRANGTIDTSRLAATLRTQLGAIALKQLETIPGAKIGYAKQDGRPFVQLPASATTSTAAMFSTALTSAVRPLVASTGIKPPVIQSPNKTPKPPIAGPPKPPAAASASSALSSPPPALPVMADPVSAPTYSPAPQPPAAVPTYAAPPQAYAGPVVQGMLVKLDGTIDLVTRGWRAA
jgi:hypothetical protein